MFRGIYNGSRKHEGDLSAVLQRAWDAGLEKIIITGGSLEDSRAALELARTHPALYSTVGCHPTKCEEVEASGDPPNYFEALKSLASSAKGKVVAVGECGLDYDRLHFCSKETQLKYFEAQLEMAKGLGLPLFLHCRAASSDLVPLLAKHSNRLHGGVVHSFDGSQEEAEEIVSLGYYIGLNGCSLKTQANLEAVRTIPQDRLLLETDAPWCEVRPSHAGAPLVRTSFPSVKKEKWAEGSMVKGRNEPANIHQVLEVVAGVRGVDADALAHAVHTNTLRLFFNDRPSP